jgi:hypothetical protein
VRCARFPHTATSTRCEKSAYKTQPSACRKFAKIVNMFARAALYAARAASTNGNARSQAMKAVQMGAARSFASKEVGVPGGGVSLHMKSLPLQPDPGRAGC